MVFPQSPLAFCCRVCLAARRRPAQGISSDVYTVKVKPKSRRLPTLTKSGLTPIAATMAIVGSAPRNRYGEGNVYVFPSLARTPDVAHRSRAMLGRQQSLSKKPASKWGP